MMDRLVSFGKALVKVIKELVLLFIVLGIVSSMLIFMLTLLTGKVDDKRVSITSPFGEVVVQPADATTPSQKVENEGQRSEVGDNTPSARSTPAYQTTVPLEKKPTRNNFFVVLIGYHACLRYSGVKVRAGPGYKYGVIASLYVTKTYVIDSETHGELVANDDVWSYIPFLKGFAPREALRIISQP